MNVLLDVTAAMRPDLTGIGVYASNLMRHLALRPDLNVRGVWRLARHKRRRWLPLHLASPARPYLPLLSGLNLTGHDIYHGTDFRIPAWGRFRTVVTIHDLVVHENGLVDGRFAAEGIAKLERTLFRHRPDRIITVSGFTRDRLIGQYPALAPITHAVHLGVDPRFAADDGMPLPEAIGNRPYILSVGSVEKRKNLMATVRAFEEIYRHHPELRLLIAGGSGHGAEDIDAMIRSSSATEAMVRLGFVADAMLPALYRNATCFLYPSLYEGFGLPILEAMAAGCPVVTSNRGAMAEVAGDAALLADPGEPDDIAAKVLQAIGEDGERGRMIAAGRERAAYSTWDRCAAETVAVYRAALE
ncbi:MAG: glycosyl transferase, group 1 [Chlorobi bacterium]|nr:glycosyl transferase, group 1 [Chlorobiota bacterium]